MRHRKSSTVVLLAIATAFFATPSDAAKRKPDPVRRAVERAVKSGAIDRATADGYLLTYRDSLRTAKRLTSERRRELDYVIGTARRIASAGRLTADRLVPVFLIMDRNRAWWSTKGPPATGARLHFGSSPVIFEYYPGLGLQLHPLANFSTVNALWRAGDDIELRALVDDLLALRVSRGGFKAWEYYFDFGGGSPPWISGMAQATAMQALARSSVRLGDPALMRAAREARGAFERSAPVGARVPDGGHAWYALYSFAPRLRVLNGMLQALIGLNAYAHYSHDSVGRSLFQEGDSLARARISTYDTGAWSLYARTPGHGGNEANLNYHTLNRDFSRRLCEITDAEPYCTAADNFTAYLQEDPSLRPFKATPSPAVAGRPVKFVFTLSKVGRVGIQVRGSKTYLSTSAGFAHGRHSFTWIPPRSKRTRDYDYELSARDLAGNSDSESGTLTVKPRR